MVGNANLTGPDIVKKVPLPGSETRLLDVGSGHGAFAIQFCQAYPQLSTTIIDSDAALQTAQRNIAAADLNSRISLRAGDLWQMDWQGPYDVVLLFNLLHHFDRDTNQELLDRTRAVLKPGGRVAILEQVAGNVAGSAANAIVRLIALLYHLFADGRVYSREQLGGLLNNSGFAEIRFHKMAKAPGNVLITAVAH